MCYCTDMLVDREINIQEEVGKQIDRQIIYRYIDIDRQIDTDGCIVRYIYVDRQLKERDIQIGRQKICIQIDRCID